MLVSISASVAGIVGLFYIALIGQRTLPERWRDRHRRKPRLPVATGILRKLPQCPYEAFIDRGEEFGKIRKVLCALRERSDPLVSIRGLGGVGKTALALELPAVATAAPLLCARGAAQPVGAFKHSRGERP